ncbi:DUF3658 domain-containing protein [Sandaracinus amylolyticus]|uniref:DUF3658 domain-containing protein n=1 Tax=Sandaracinus amylolyticus TaxID=927083 RepID=UPI001F232EED|nr:DUF3658 domain-containing protein [Sandaracinus amylolyticus]UJR86331.1 Hypothetical protein I5071_84250 [Sandaracinus amylolyticus]
MTTWVVQHGLMAAEGELPFEYATPLYDVLTVGPQHRDAQIERLLRRAAGMPSDLDVIDEHLGLLDDGVVLRSEGELGSVLAALWWLDVMRQRGVDLGRVRLAITPVLAPSAEIVRAVRDAQPIGDDLEPLLAIRRAIVADDDVLALTLDDISSTRRAWIANVAHLRDLLPDARGLDVIDALLLEHIGRDWNDAIRVIGNCLGSSSHRIGDRTLWDRIIALSEDRPAIHPRDHADDDEPTALVELALEGPIAIRYARVRRTALAEQVVAGRDVLEIRTYDRWVGGRFLTRDRILRAPALRRA